MDMKRRNWLTGGVAAAAALFEVWWTKHLKPMLLDQVSTEVPVLIIHTSGHLGVTNSKGLEAAGVTAATAPSMSR